MVPKGNVGKLSHLGCTRGEHVRENNVARGGGSLEDKDGDTNRAACAVDVLPLMCAGLPNICNLNGVGTSPLHPGLNSRLGMRD